MFGCVFVWCVCGLACDVVWCVWCCLCFCSCVVCMRVVFKLNVRVVIVMCCVMLYGVSLRVLCVWVFRSMCLCVRV